MRLYALLTHNHVFFYLTGLNKERITEELSKSILKTDKIFYKIQIANKSNILKVSLPYLRFI